MLVMLALALAALVIAGYGFFGTSEPTQRTAVVKRGTLTPVVEAKASRQFRQTYGIDVPGGGTVTDVSVGERDPVGIGTELAKVNGKPVVAMQGFSPLRRSLKRGDVGEDVAALQMNLAHLGYDVGPVDGDFGPLTRTAVRLFQADHQLRRTGAIGPDVVQFLPLPLTVSLVSVTAGQQVQRDLGIDLVKPGALKDMPIILQDDLPWVTPDEVISVTAPGSPLAAVIKIPKEAVQYEGASAHTTLVGDGGETSEQPLTLGSSSASEVEVLSGLEPGVRVVVSGGSGSESAIPSGAFLLLGACFLAGAAVVWLLAKFHGPELALATVAASHATEARSSSAESEPSRREQPSTLAWGAVLDQVGELQADTGDLEEHLYSLYEDAEGNRARYVGLRRGAAEVYRFSDELEGGEVLAAVRSRLLDAMARDGVRPWEPLVGAPVPSGCEVVPVRAPDCVPGTVLEVVSSGLRADNGDVIVPPLVRVVVEESV
jgi:hypothetical protein